MSNARDPQRLFDDTETSGELRELLSTLREGGRDERSRAHVAAGLGALLDAPPAPPAPHAPPAGAAASGASFIVPAIGGGLVVAVVAVVAILTAIWSADDGAPPAVAAPTTHAPALSAPSEERVAPPLSPARVEAEPLTPTPRVATPTPTQVRAVAGARRESASPPPDSVTEGEILREARALAGTRPDRALALCAEHERGYPDGVLAEEREVIAIEALVTLERAADARQRAQSFFRAHGSSAHRARIEALLRRLDAR